jgi:hypothetical protein
MTTKVLNTVSHRTSQGDVIVAKGIVRITTPKIDEWVVDCIIWKDPKDSKIFVNRHDTYNSLLSDGYVPLKIIVISLIETITKEDKILFN